MSARVVEQQIAAEQEFVDTVYERLEDAGRAARELAAEGHGRGRLGHEGGLVERDAMVYQAARRLATLDAAHEGLVFGRLDLVSSGPRYIGRIGLRDANRDALLVDWRAPAASVFYRATAQEPLGAVRRRVLRCIGSKVVGIEDDLLDAEAAPDDLVVLGEGALLAELSRARDLSMHSVVATIQKEQDEAIRSPGRGVTSISGGPGTGKTVVALHRAAYLLYTDRRRFESGGVLVVGPSGIFMSYIERVLPSLGETSVTLRSVGELVDGVKGVRHDSAHVAAIKGSARMRRVLQRAVQDAAPGAPEEFRQFYRDDVLRLDARSLTALRRHLLARGQRRNRALPKVEQAVLDALWGQVRAERGRERGRDAFAAEMLGSSGFVDFVRRWWPPLDAVQVWEWLSEPERLHRYARGVLDRAEQETLLTSWTRNAEPAIEDVPLIDELRYLLGDVPPAMADDDAVYELDQLTDPAAPEVRTADERTPGAAGGSSGGSSLRTTGRTDDDSYAHVLVDEAQDLSPMQWRMVGRRGRYASWTVVGDPAQSAWPLPDEAAEARAEALAGKPEYAFRLSTNYRNSVEIFSLASQVAQAAVPDPDLPEAVRSTGVPPEHRLVDAAALPSATQDAVLAVAGQVDGAIAVVTAVGRTSQVREWLTSPDVDRERLSVLDGLETKGLEFDAVVVVEPDRLVADSPAGLRTLYVVLSRATQRLLTVATTDRWRRGLDGPSAPPDRGPGQRRAHTDE